MPVVRHGQDPTHSPQTPTFQQRKCTLRSNINNSSSTLLGTAQGQATAAGKTCPRTEPGTSPLAKERETATTTAAGGTPGTTSTGRVEATGAATPGTSTGHPWVRGGGIAVPPRQCTIEAPSPPAPLPPTTADTRKAPRQGGTPYQPQAQAVMPLGPLLKRASAH